MEQSASSGNTSCICPSSLKGNQEEDIHAEKGCNLPRSLVLAEVRKLQDPAGWVATVISMKSLRPDREESLAACLANLTSCWLPWVVVPAGSPDGIQSLIVELHDTGLYGPSVVRYPQTPVFINTQVDTAPMLAYSPWDSPHPILVTQACTRLESGDMICPESTMTALLQVSVSPSVTTLDSRRPFWYSNSKALSPPDVLSSWAGFLNIIYHSVSLHKGDQEGCQPERQGSGSSERCSP